MCFSFFRKDHALHSCPPHQTIVIYPRIEYVHLIFNHCCWLKAPGNLKNAHPFQESEAFFIVSCWRRTSTFPTEGWKKCKDHQLGCYKTRIRNNGIKIANSTGWPDFWTINSRSWIQTWIILNHHCTLITFGLAKRYRERYSSDLTTILSGERTST